MTNFFTKLFKKQIGFYFLLPKEFVYPENKTFEKVLVNKGFIFEKIGYKKIGVLAYLVNVYFKSEKDMSVFKEKLSAFNEFLPPWIVFPTFFMDLRGWNQGYQEAYCIEKWLPYWEGLSIKEKNEYMIRFNCPTEWKEWFENNGMLN